MRIFRFLLILIGLMFTSPFILVFFWFAYSMVHGGILLFMGYPVDIAPTDLAKQIVEQHLDPKRCNELQDSAPSMGPSITEKRARCIYEVASLTKDPTACELLMPSSYGLSCVGGAENHHLPCGSDRFTVYWQEGDQPHEKLVRECVKNDTYSSAMEEQCCTVGKVTYMTQYNDCSSVKSNVPVHDQCLYGLAWKLKDPKYCIGISNANANAACTVQTTALQQDPTICSGCTPPVESVEDLK